MSFGEGNIMGKLLRVDLTNHKVTIEDITEIEEKYLGGRGVNSYLLLHELKPETKPLDPENMLIFSPGLYAGTVFPASGNICISAKNYMTNGINWSSAMGYFGAELKKTGWNTVVFTGKSSTPVYLYIKDDEVEIRDASKIWGKEVWETQEAITKEIGDSKLRFATIGPAGENLVRFGCIIIDHCRAAGGGGLGAVMGSKNLKAMVVRGTKEVNLADPERMIEIADKSKDKIVNSASGKRLIELGCFGNIGRSGNDNCLNPTKNTQDDTDVSYDVIDYDKYKVKRNTGETCYNCPLQCNKDVMEIESGPYKGQELQIHQGNQTGAYGTRVYLRTPSAVMKAFELQTRYGMDNDGSAVSISWAYECYEKGILTNEDTDGMELIWGDAETVFELMRKIAYREGFGDLLAEGCKRASDIIGKGSDYYCTHCKGQDNLDTIRVHKAWALGQVTSLRGGRHLDGSPLTEVQGIPREVCEEVFGVPDASISRSYEGKGKLCNLFSHFKATVDSMGICYFMTLWSGVDLLKPVDVAKAASAALGREISTDELMRIGHQIHAIEKAFNTIHAGFTRKDDYPPLIYTNVPTKAGKYAGEVINLSDWDNMLDEYYKLQGWDIKTGWQTKESLEELELPGVIRKLEDAGKLIHS